MNNHSETETESLVPEHDVDNEADNTNMVTDARQIIKNEFGFTSEEFENLGQARAARLKKLLKDNNLKQVDIVRQLKVSKGSVSKWLRGAAEPSHQFRKQLAVALNTSEEWLLYGVLSGKDASEYKKAIAGAADATPKAWDERYVVVDGSDDLEFTGILLACEKGVWQKNNLTCFFYETLSGALIGSIVEHSPSKHKVLRSDGKVFNHKINTEELSEEIVEFFGKNPIAKRLYAEMPFDVKHSVRIP